MADNGADHAFVNIVLPEYLTSFRTMLLRPQFKINIVQHTDSSPILYVGQVVLLGKIAHNASHNLAMQQEELTLIVLL